MKKWMVWGGAAGAGLIGVTLAFFVISSSMAPIESVGPMPDIEAPREHDATATISEAPGTPATLTTESTAPATDRGTETTEAYVSADPPANPKWRNPARAEQAKIREMPEVKAMIVATSKWQILLHTTSMMPKDPAASHTFNRVVELDRDIALYRRDPSAFDYDDLVERQRHMLGELKQTSYWGPELQLLESDMEQAFASGAGAPE